MFEIKLHRLVEVVAALEQFPQELAPKIGGPIRSALRKGGKVILAQEQTNLRRETERATDEKTKTSTGLLLKSLKLTRGKPPFDQKGERYLVRFGRLRYPDRPPEKKGGPLTTLKTARLLEYGTEKQPAAHFIRSAYLERAEESLRVIERELADSVDRIARKLAKTRGKEV